MSVEIGGLCKSFESTVLFRDFCLTVAAPMVLSAPSGAGKTTLLRILMGLESPDSGSVSGVGRVSAVFQEDRLCPQLTAVQNVALATDFAPAAIRREFAALGMSGAELDIPVAGLSGGQKRRTALLRALLAPADTLLLDEPFTGLDQGAVHCAAALVQKYAAGKPTLLATHDAGVIRALGWPVVRF